MASFLALPYNSIGSVEDDEVSLFKRRISQPARLEEWPVDATMLFLYSRRTTSRLDRERGPQLCWAVDGEYRPMAERAGNVLYYGDNLPILRNHEYFPSESIDLVYLDPPFKSNQAYNVLFAEQDGTRSAAQIKAFEDTWRWDQAAAAAWQDIVETGPERISRVMQAFQMFLGDSDMLAYLSMMAPRLVELLRILKPQEASIYIATQLQAII